MNTKLTSFSKHSDTQLSSILLRRGAHINFSHFKLHKFKTETRPNDENNEAIHVGFEVLTAEIIKSMSFWVVTPCSSVCLPSAY